MASVVDTLLAELEQQPDNVATYLVLADALVERGDPRGELIQLQHALSSAPAMFVEPPPRQLRDRHGRARAQRPSTVNVADLIHAGLAREQLEARAGELIAERRVAILGPAACPEVELEFRLGFLDRLTWMRRGEGASTLGPALRSVFGSPESRLLRTVVLDPDETTGPDRPIRSALEDDVVVPPAVARLVIGRASHVKSLRLAIAEDVPYREDLSGVLARFGSITDLEVDLGSVAVSCGSLVSDRLHRFTWKSPYVRREELAPLARSSLPALTAFELWIGASCSTDDPIGALDGGPLTVIDTRTPRELEPVFAMLDGCQALERLGIVNYPGEVAELLATLGGHRCAARLRTLDLSRADLNRRDVRAIAASLTKFPALRELRLDAVWLDDEDRAALASPTREVTGTSLGVGDEVERFRLIVAV